MLPSSEGFVHCPCFRNISRDLHDLVYPLGRAYWRRGAVCDSGSAPSCVCSSGCFMINLRGGLDAIVGVGVMNRGVVRYFGSLEVPSAPCTLCTAPVQVQDEPCTCSCLQSRASPFDSLQASSPIWAAVRPLPMRRRAF